jgi:CRP-like cAMP-binding protein
VSELHAVSAFGEGALLYGKPRAFTVRTASKTFCEVLSITKPDFDSIFNNYGSLKSKIRLTFLREIFRREFAQGSKLAIALKQASALAKRKSAKESRGSRCTTSSVTSAQGADCAALPQKEVLLPIAHP